MRRKSRVAVAHTTKKKQRHAQAGICRWPVNLLMVLALAEMLLAVYLYRYESPLDDIAKLPDFPIIQLDPKLDKNEPPLDYMAELPDFPTIQLNPELDKIDFQTYKSKPLVFDKFTIPDYSHHTRRASDENGVEKTIRNLKEMGVPSEELERNETSVEMPPWSQIVDNYGDEPVILGLERCEAYRNMVPEKNRFIGPAGLFSTGTNLLNSLLMKNCNPPPGKGHSKFYFWQVPWYGMLIVQEQKYLNPSAHTLFCSLLQGQTQPSLCSHKICGSISDYTKPQPDGLLANCYSSASVSLDACSVQTLLFSVMASLESDVRSDLESS